MNQRTPWHGMQESLQRKFGEEIGTFLAKRIGVDMRGKDCFTDFSVVDLGASEEELAKHKRIRTGGCCGSLDREITHFKTGRKFAYGFNFGH